MDILVLYTPCSVFVCFVPLPRHAVYEGGISVLMYRLTKTSVDMSHDHEADLPTYSPNSLCMNSEHECLI